jgi:hypothetical protein
MNKIKLWIERPFAGIFIQLIQAKIDQVRQNQSNNGWNRFQSHQFRIIALTDFRDEIAETYNIKINEQ